MRAPRDVTENAPIAPAADAEQTGAPAPAVPTRATERIRRVTGFSRRDFLRMGSLGSLVGAAAGLFGRRAAACEKCGVDSASMPMPGVTGEVDHVANGFDPSDVLVDFDYGQVSQLPDGRTLREYIVHVVDKDIEVVPGVHFPMWLFNGRVPGPTLRAREGDRLRITMVNGSTHHHSMHFHGIHPGNMDGVFEQVKPGDSFVYEFDAEPFGIHLYHCHAMPLAKHIAKGLYGAFIVEPRQGWPKVDHELLMVMNGLDVDFDGTNDFYAVNGIPFHYDKNPIRIRVGEKVRIFLVNLLEFDVMNSFHLHANFFHYYPTGTSLTPREYTDTILLGQAERGILEFSYRYPGRYMFHAHKTEFAELGWSGLFEVSGTAV